LKTTTRLLIGVALPVIAIDQLIKFFVSSALPLGGAWSPLAGPNPFIQIVYTINTGVAFGLFKDLGPVFILVPLVISGVILFYAERLQADQRLIAAALGLIAGGALGNVIDRLRLGGGVLDFFDVGIGSLRNASNFADWSIVLGVILLAIAMWREERQAKLSGDARSN
jgi:signal peptidase II